jgi:hypothetical protein
MCDEDGNSSIKFYNEIDDQWSITEYDDIIKGSTWMNNFDMGLFLTEIGVDEDKIEWGD